MNVLSINSTADKFDILDEFSRVFWKDMNKVTTLEAMGKLGTMYRVVPATGLSFGSKVA